MRTILAISALLAVPLSVQAVTIETVPIGNPGNANELQPQGLFGGVTINYRIAKTEVTNSQYAEFLNAVANTDTFSLYSTNMGFFIQGGITRSGAPGSHTYAVKANVVEEGTGILRTYGDKPVVFVSWYDSIRFANWMHNGQGSGGTETGAYTILGGTATPTNADSITRSASATWFLPTEDEWYKAAYYDGNDGVYYNYPTATDLTPDNNLPSADTGNSANFLNDDDEVTTGSRDFPFTSTGAYTLSESAYGTRDQGGNVWEWNETLVSASTRGRRGGAWDTYVDTLSSAHRDSKLADFQQTNLGFRLAKIAESVSLSGDYNGDGTVDAADYVVWRRTDGSQAGYNLWRANFGSSSPGGGSIASAVPEPAAGGLLLLACAAFFLRYRGR